VTAIPSGIRPESATHSARKDAGFRSQPASQPATESGSPLSRSDAQTRERAEEQTITSRIRSIPQAAALARLIVDLRPRWNPEDVYAWALNDDRPWAVVIQAGLNGALDHGIREPGGLRYAGPSAAPVPAPPTMAELRRTQKALEQADCGHGDTRERCALCRHHVPGQEPA